MRKYLIFFLCKQGGYDETSRYDALYVENRRRRRLYGYLWVCTCFNKGSKIDHQVDALKGFSIDEEHLYIDYFTGVSFDRPKYLQLLQRIQNGDLLVVKSIDRLGRNYEEILDQWRFLTKHKGADVVVLDMPLLDTRSSRDLTGTFLADVVLQLLSYIAQIERENIKKRQAKGIAAAKARGARFGRPTIQRPSSYSEIKKRI